MLKLEKGPARVFIWCNGDVKRRMRVKDELKQRKVKFSHVFVKDRISLMPSQLELAKFLVDMVNKENLLFYSKFL